MTWQPGSHQRAGLPNSVNALRHCYRNLFIKLCLLRLNTAKKLAALTVSGYTTYTKQIRGLNPTCDTGRAHSQETS